MESRIEQDLIAAFRRSFEREPRLFRAPGRINLIGEHTDYNDGFVMPAALDLSIWAAIAPRSDRRLRIRSLIMDEVVEFDLDDANAQPRGDWTDYVRGVAIFLQRAGYELSGADLVLDGNLPIGAGLSASAAFEVSAGFALLTISGCRGRQSSNSPRSVSAPKTNSSAFAAALWTNTYRAAPSLGAPCCSTAAVSFRGKLRLIRTRVLSFATRWCATNSRAMNIICVATDCERAVAVLSTRIDGVSALRDVTFAQLMRYADSMPELIFRRARHVVGEIDRTLRAAAALDAGDLKECGRLMYLSHESLRDDYEVSCAELDLMVDIARSLPGVYGARMMGGGFGGCTINLVEASRAEAFAQAMADRYRTATGVTPPILTCVPGPGAGPVGD